MKKALAIFLSVLLICVGLAPMSLAATAPEITTRVIEGGYSEKAAEVSAVTSTTFTVVIKAPRGVKKLAGVNLYFEYDPAVLSVAKAGLAGTVDADGNEAQNFSGIFVSGPRNNSDSEYSMAWVNSSGVSKNSAKDLMYITFNVLDTAKAETSLNLHLVEFNTEDGNKDNDVTSSMLFENRIVNFNFPEDTPPATLPESDPSGGDSDEVNGINALLQLIRDMLNGNGVTFGDFADAIANIYGNAELVDIIEQLVDGNMSISEWFQDILDDLGIDFSFFEDLLNKIIEFLKGLFGSDEPADTTEPVGDDDTELDDDTTAIGSSDGSEQTGDVGVALAATVCVAASAAFVLTRKKKETV